MNLGNVNFWCKLIGAALLTIPIQWFIDEFSTYGRIDTLAIQITTIVGFILLVVPFDKRD